MYMLYILLLYSSVHSKTIGLDSLTEGRGDGLTIDLVSDNGVDLENDDIPSPVASPHRYQRVLE